MQVFSNNIINISMSGRNLRESKTVTKLTVYGCDIHLIFPTKDLSVQNNEGNCNIYCYMFSQ